MNNNYQGFQFTPPINTGMNSQNIAAPAPFQPATLFPQPIGSVYNLNSATDICNVPIGSNISIGLCLNENIIHIKSLQNGTPVTLSYRLTSIDNTGTPVLQPSPEAQIDSSRIEQLINSFEERMSRFEEQLKKIQKGGKVEWQI